MVSGGEAVASVPRVRLRPPGERAQSTEATNFDGARRQVPPLLLARADEVIE
jgi:hypothetical protein